VNGPGRLSDDHLRIAYSGARALLYPSRYEGFGLPILEAMSCGCPVITCATASIPEVAGRAAIFVDPGDVEALSAAMDRVREESERRRLITAGLEQAKKFTWQTTAAIFEESMIAVSTAARTDQT
jgi:glycosyltransferase involved in cell wall biosynthesis